MEHTEMSGYLGSLRTFSTLNLLFRLPGAGQQEVTWSSDSKPDGTVTKQSTKRQVKSSVLFLW